MKNSYINDSRFIIEKGFSYFDLLNENRND